MRYIKITTLMLSLSLLACNEEKQVGPEIEGIGYEPSPISALSSSLEEANFKKGETIYFTQEFEKLARWKITLTGVNSGATKTFEGLTKSINESNSKWNGLSDNVIEFLKEDVVAELTFPYFPDAKVSRDTFTILDLNRSPIRAVKFTDFVKAPLYQFGGTEPVGGGWGSDYPPTVNTNNAYPKYDGNAYLHMVGAPWQANSPYVDIVNMPANVSDTLKSINLPLFSDPKRVYINLAVYNTGTKDTWFQLQMSEFKDLVSTARSWNIRPNWTGWKHISIQYSKLESTSTLAYDPTVVNRINLVLLSDQDVTATPRNPVSIAIDQLVFSFDAPLGTIVNNQ